MSRTLFSNTLVLSPFSSKPAIAFATNPFVLVVLVVPSVVDGDFFTPVDVVVGKPDILLNDELVVVGEDVPGFPFPVEFVVVGVGVVAVVFTAVNAVFPAVKAVGVVGLGPVGVVVVEITDFFTGVGVVAVAALTPTLDVLVVLGLVVRDVDAFAVIVVVVAFVGVVGFVVERVAVFVRVVALVPRGWQVLLGLILSAGWLSFAPFGSRAWQQI